MNMWSPALYRGWNCDVFRRVSSVRYVWLFGVFGVNTWPGSGRLCLLFIFYIMCFVL
jgi:hypothetical protein